MFSQSLDGKAIFLCSGNTFRKFSTSTGAPLSPHFRGHAAEVTALAYRPGYSCANFLLSASFDCTLRAWDARNTSVLAVFATPGPVESLAVPNTSDSNVHDTVYISCWHRRKSQFAGGGRVHVYSLGKGRILERLAKLAVPSTLVISHLGGFLGTFERNTVLIWPLVHRDGKQLSNRSLAQPIRLHHTKIISVLAFSFTEEIVATGDITGRILLWRNFYDRAYDPTHDEKPPTYISGRRNSSNSPCSTLHWHSQPVACLSFSRDGTCLLSGGSECVLVVWHLHENHRSYLPRLGAPLCSIYQSHAIPTEVGVACSDNALRFLSLTSMKVDCVIQGIRPNMYGMRAQKYPTTKQIEVGFSNVMRVLKTSSDQTHFHDVVTLEPASGSIVFSTCDSKLQLFDHVGDRHVSDIPISKSNSITETVGNSQMYISFAVFSDDGSFLATVDRRSERHSCTRESDRPFQDETGLRTGRLQSQDRVHGNEEEVFRIWERCSSSTLHPSSKSNGDFNCVFICHGPHHEPITSITVCPDGSFGHRMICTISRDGDMKIWKRANGDRAPKCEFWRCCSSIPHLSTAFQAKSHTAAWSTDGSLLATAGDDIAVWASDGCCLQRFATPRWFKMGDALSLRPERRISNSWSSVKTLSFVSPDALLLVMSPIGLMLLDLRTSSVFRAIRMSCMHICRHPVLSSYLIAASEMSSNVVINCDQPSGNVVEQNQCIVLQFKGSDGQLFRLWECSFGTPSAMISSSESVVGALVISNDRKVFQIGTSKVIFLGSSRFTDQFPRKEAIAEFMVNSTSDDRCTGSILSSLDQNIKSLQQERNVTSFSFQLKNTQREVQHITSEDLGLTRNPKKHTLNITSVMASHALSPLTILVPRFLDFVLEPDKGAGKPKELQEAMHSTVLQD